MGVWYSSESYGSRLVPLSRLYAKYENTAHSWWSGLKTGNDKIHPTVSLKYSFKSLVFYLSISLSCHWLPLHDMWKETIVVICYANMPSRFLYCILMMYTSRTELITQLITEENEKKMNLFPCRNIKKCLTLKIQGGIWIILRFRPTSVTKNQLKVTPKNSHGKEWAAAFYKIAKFVPFQP